MTSLKTNKKLIFESGKQGQRVLIVGQSGSGKSTHARILAATQSNIHFLVIDFKDDKDEIATHFFKLAQRVACTYDVQKIFSLITQYSIVIFTPPVDFSDDDLNNFLLDWYYRVRNCGLLFDEAMLLPNSLGIKTLMSRGRSKGLSVIACTQRPVMIPTVCRSESNIVFIHKLRLPEDVKVISDLTGYSKQTIKDLNGYDYLTLE